MLRSGEVHGLQCYCYITVTVSSEGIGPPTRGASNRCSTSELQGQTRRACAPRMEPDHAPMIGGSMAQHIGGLSDTTKRQVGRVASTHPQSHTGESNPR